MGNILTFHQKNAKTLPTKNTDTGRVFSIKDAQTAKIVAILHDATRRDAVKDVYSGLTCLQLEYLRMNISAIP